MGVDQTMMPVGVEETRQASSTAKWEDEGKNLARVGEISPQVVENAIETPARPAMEEKPQPAVQAVAASVAIDWRAMIFMGWLIVGGGMMLLVIQRYWFVRGLIRQSSDADGKIAVIFDECCRQMKISRRPELKMSSTMVSPAACGLVRPVVVMPEFLPVKLSQKEMRAVLLHELAHIQRGDLWVNCVQTLLQVVYFYNPLLWPANSVIRRLREQAVDETVLVTLREEAGQYPETFLNVAKLSLARPALSLRLVGVVESKSALAERIQHMINRPFPKSAKIGGLGLVGIVIAGAILLPMAKGEEKSENEVQMQEKMVGTAQPAAEGKVQSSAAFKIKLSNGVVVKLLGASEYPSNETSWWKPDGSNLEKRPFMTMGIWETFFADGWSGPMPKFNKEFAVQIVGSSGINFRAEIKGSHVSQIAQQFDKQGLIVYDLRVPMDQDLKVTDITLKIASTAWKTVANFQRKASFSAMNYKEGGVIFNPPYEKDGRASIVVTDTLGDQDVQVIGIDDSGNLHPSQAVRGGVNPNVMSGTFTFTIPLKSIKEFQFQTRPYERVTFKNVSLERGVKTNVEIVGEKDEKKMVGEAEPTTTRPTIKKSVLSFRIAAELGDSEKEKYIKQLMAEGPIVGRERKDPYQWFETSIDDYGRIVKEYQRKKYILLSNQANEMMLPETWGLRSVAPAKDSKNNPAISVEFDDAGSKLFREITKINIGKPLAILIDEKVVWVPMIASSISRRGVITGNFSQDESNRIIESLRAGMVSETQPARESGIERTLYGPQYGKESMIDFETGRLMVMPTDLGEDVGKAKRWLAERGIDAAANTDKTVRGLIGYDIAVFPLSDRDWKEGFDDIESIKSATSGFPVFFMGKETLPVTYLFKTREGGIGILQILEVQNKTAPTYVRIQYKMIEQGKTPTTQKITSQPVVKAPEDSSAEQNQLSEESHDILEKVGRIDIGRASKKDVIGVFGEPGAYLWGQNELDKNKLPSHYVMNYPGGFQAFIAGGYVNELRFEEPGPFVHPSGLRVGMELEEAVAILGKPKKIVQGQANQFADSVLYKDINGQTGWDITGGRIRAFASSF